MSDNRIDSARDDLDRLRTRVQSAPGIPRFWMELAVGLERNGRLDEALGAWDMVLTLIPASESARTAIERLKAVAVGQPEDRSGDVARPAPSETSDDEAPRPSGGDSLDIDTLIGQLESGEVIEFGDEPADETGPEADGSSDEIEATETLAKIYESQHLTEEAADIYDKLADREPNPERAEILRARARDLRRPGS